MPPQSAALLTLLRCPGVGVLSARGRVNGSPKRHNQDAFCIEPLPGLPQQEHHQCTLIGIFDGHGAEGHAASRHVATQVATAARQYASSLPLGDLWSHAQQDDRSSSKQQGHSNMNSPVAMLAQCSIEDELALDAARGCLEVSFSQAAQSVAAGAAGCDVVKSGTTAVACVVLPESLVVAWAGDSRAVVGSTAGAGGYTVTQLTADHKPSRLSEMTRILAAGGKVARSAFDRHGNPTGPFRVVPPGRSSAGLSVARAFGDLQLAPYGVIPVPEFATYSRGTSATAEHALNKGAAAAAMSTVAAPQCPAEVLVVATDGLWEMVCNEEAVELAVMAGGPEEAAQQLVAVAKQRWAEMSCGRHQDDITVAVAYL
ncbi:hypothetical protein N2152v2_002325 [Parachlorella kessleri]